MTFRSVLDIIGEECRWVRLNELGPGGIVELGVALIVGRPKEARAIFRGRYDRGPPRRLRAGHIKVGQAARIGHMNASVSFSEDGVIFHVACARSARGLAKQICEQVIWSFASDDIVYAYVAHARTRWKADATGIAVRFLLMRDEDEEPDNLRKRQEAIVASTMERLNRLLNVLGDFDDYVYEFLLTTKLGEEEKPILDAIHEPAVFDRLWPLFFDKLRSVEALRSRRRN